MKILYCKGSRVIAFGAFRLDGEWGYRGNDFAILNFVSFLPKVIEQIIQPFPYYFTDYSKTSNEFYKMSHCEFCLAKFSDFLMQDEVDSTFTPHSTYGCDGISIIEIPIEETSVEISSVFHIGDAQNLLFEYAKRVSLESWLNGQD